MRVKLIIDSYEPIVAEQVTAGMLERSLSKAIRRYQKRYGKSISVSIDFEPIEGDAITIRSREFPSGRYKNVRAIVPGRVALDVEIEPVEAILYLNQPRGVLRYFRVVCHETKKFLNWLRNNGHIGTYRLPECGLVNMLIGRMVPKLGSHRIRLWRDKKGVWHTFGRARISLIVR